jgi:hypothetical protein
MKQATPVRYEIYFREFEGIGVVVEEVQSSIKNLDYGKYNITDIELEKKIALKILEGMDGFQLEHNKGIRFDRIFKDSIIEIYNINEEQKELDEMIMNIDW